ncbi:low molecular weight phosphotyrosine protein phosphatase [Sphingobacterium sp. lm-10]|uniref:low molecular weight protein-tyrosine-phosphatase n=1 Tax=Sphingobacterium sp. lm-10 TaxID=2944904 RepID=UPI002020C5CB|nr:low molecular weight protein-tyrosine-phosphatase [Sphingobacterium sp. lm-10]MCL7988505.1 low molecular weight phosphotyrosine protein phosphatase [Sphingobacterium sp. lm-10]
MKILMVCLGNICRSPLAHGIMQALIDKEGLDWQVDSAGTGDWHVGQAPDRRSIATAKGFGIDISGQQAQWFQSDMFDRFDKILVMDRQNYRDVIALAKTDDQREKVTLFLTEGEVPDPYFDDTMFESVYDMIAVQAKILLKTWQSEQQEEKA